MFDQSSLKGRRAAGSLLLSSTLALVLTCPSTLPASAANKAVRAKETSSQSKTNKSATRTDKGSQSRAEKLALLQRVMDNVNSPSTVSIDELIAVQEKKTMQSIDQDDTTSDEEKQKQKDEYSNHMAKKLARLKQLLSEKHINLTDAYMDAMLEQCDKCWSAQDYKDVAAYSDLIKSHLFRTFKGSEFGEICERAGKRATALMEPILDQLQSEEESGKFTDAPLSADASETKTKPEQIADVAVEKKTESSVVISKDVKPTPERAEKLAIMRKMFEVIKVPVDVDSVMQQGASKTIETIVKDQKLTDAEKKEQSHAYLRRAARETARLKQLLAERHMDFGDLFSGALIDELDKVWSMSDYHDLATLLRLEGSPAIKKFPDLWPEICNNAGQQVAGTLTPIMTQLDEDERAGKFD